MSEQKKSCSIVVKAEYSAYSETEIEIPGVESFGEIAEWFVKWNVFYYRLSKDEEFKAIDLLDIDPSEISQHRPSRVVVFDVDDWSILDER